MLLILFFLACFFFFLVLFPCMIKNDSYYYFCSFYLLFSVNIKFIIILWSRCYSCSCPQWIDKSLIDYFCWSLMCISSMRSALENLYFFYPSFLFSGYMCCLCRSNRKEAFQYLFFFFFEVSLFLNIYLV